MTWSQPDDGHPAQDSRAEPGREAADDEVVLEITHAQMDAAVSTGDAVPLDLAGDWLARYQDAWWVLAEAGWLRVTDQATAADIDHVAARLTEAADDASGAHGYGAGRGSPGVGAEE